MWQWYDRKLNELLEITWQTICKVDSFHQDINLLAFRILLQTLEYQQQISSDSSQVNLIDLYSNLNQILKSKTKDNIFWQFFLM